MIDWLTILVALIIISGVVGFFAFLAWKINVNDTLTLETATTTTTERKAQESTKKKRKEQKKPKNNNPKEDEVKEKPKANEPTDDEHEESEQEVSIVQPVHVETSSKARKRNKNKTENETAVVRAPPATHPKSTNKVQVKQPTKSVSAQEIIDDDQPFTVVGSNKTKHNSSTTSQSQTVKETPKQTNGVGRLAELVKTIPVSQMAVTELCLALDAYSLSTDELDIIMHKIASKQTTVKQDWNKKNHTTDETLKTSSDLKKLSDDLNSEKRRSNELLKEKLDKERQVEVLLSQIQSLSSKPTQDNGHEFGSIQFQVLNEQMKKLSVENANLEKKATRFEVLAEEAKKEKDELRRSNEQMTYSLDKVQKQLEDNEDKLKTNEKQHRLEINELLVRLEQLEKDNEQLKKEDIVHVEPTTITVDREEVEKLENQIKQLQEAQHSNEHQWKQEIELLKKDQQIKDETLERVRSELEESKKKYDNQLHQYHQTLADLLPEHIRCELSHGVDNWLSSYRNCFERHSDSLQKHWQDQCSTLKTENDRLRQDMADIESQLKDIEQTVQNKEELLLNELKSKTTLLDGVRHENEQLNEELKRTRSEIERIQAAHDALLNEARALKVQLDERFLVATNTPPVVADESFELIKQPSPSLSPIVVDARAEHFTEFVRPDNELNEHSDTHSQDARTSSNEQHHSSN